MESGGVSDDNVVEFCEFLCGDDLSMHTTEANCYHPFNVMGSLNADEDDLQHMDASPVSEQSWSSDCCSLDSSSLPPSTPPHLTSVNPGPDTFWSHDNDYDLNINITAESIPESLLSEEGLPTVAAQNRSFFQDLQPCEMPTPPRTPSPGTGRDIPAQRLPSIDLLLWNRSPRRKRVGDHLYKFLLELLMTKSHQDWIRWINWRDGTFIFLEGERVAALWGERKKEKSKRKGKQMDYGKMTRAIRHYYKDGTMNHYGLQRRVYQFGQGVLRQYRA